MYRRHREQLERKLAQALRLALEPTDPVTRERLARSVEDLEKVIEQYHAALQSFVGGNPEPMKALFSHADDVVAPYSSRGPSWYDGFAKPDVVAPGHKLASDTNTASYLYTTLTTSRAQSSNGQALLSLSGTSMSAAVASGVVALILDAHHENGLHQQTPLTANPM